MSQAKKNDGHGSPAASPRKLAIHRALVMLSYRPRSRGEILRDLNGKGFPAEVVESVIAELAEKGLVDDLSMARDIVASGQRTHKSRAKIYSDLRRRGIDREDAEESLVACFDFEREREAAVRSMSRLLSSAPSPPSRGDIERAARRLAGRGFSSPAVAYALRDASNRTDSDEESGFLDTINKLS